jgi:hypothetical protein
MSRGYRCAVVALVGFLSLAAASPSGQRSNPEGGKSEQEIANTLERVANALDKANEPQRETADCAQGADDRQSDLCAQWKAADAAAKAANAADQTVTIGWIGLALGSITMGAAIAAAYYASEAAYQARRTADLTKDGLEHAREVALAQNRPYVIPGNPNIIAKAPNNWGVEVPVRNVGTIPAFNVRVEQVNEIIPVGNGFPSSDIVEDDVEPFSVLAPTSKKDATTFNLLTVTDDQLSAIRAVECGILCRIRIQYQPLQGMEAEVKEYSFLAVGEDLDEGQMRITPAWFYTGVNSNEQTEMNLGDEPQGAEN